MSFAIHSAHFPSIHSSSDVFAGVELEAPLRISQLDWTIAADNLHVLAVLQLRQNEAGGDTQIVVECLHDCLADAARHGACVTNPLKCPI